MPSPEEISLANKAIRNGLITVDEAKECFSHIALQKGMGVIVALAEILIQRGYLSLAQIDLLAKTPGGATPTTPPAAVSRTATPAGPSVRTSTPMPSAGRTATPPKPHPAPAAPTAPAAPPPEQEEIVEMTPMESRPDLVPVRVASSPPARTAKPTPSPQPPPRTARPTPARPTAPAPASSGPPPNQKEPIPGYQFVGKIGAGGMATVFKALNTKTNEVVALKILFPHHAKNPLFLKRFVREAELLCLFRHENVVRGIDSGNANGLNYLVMELLEGESLQDVLNRRGSLEEDQSLAIILQIAKGLEFIEGQGIVHRDIKPDNIIILSSGVIKMIDLGFAKPIGQAEDTAQDQTCGTPQYMSPEQAQGAIDVDVRSDIYSLGATLYHMALGEVPFKGTDNMEVMAQQVLADLKGSDVKSGKISRHMHYFLEKMMAKEKEIRYQNPREVIEDIEGQIEGFKSMQFDAEAAAPKAPSLLPTSRGGSDAGKGNAPDKGKAPGKDSGPVNKIKGGSGLFKRGRLEDLRKRSGKDQQGGSGLFFRKKK